MTTIVIRALLLAALLCSSALAGQPPVVPASPGVAGILAPSPVPRVINSGVHPQSMLRTAISQVEQGNHVIVCHVGDSVGTGPDVLNATSGTTAVAAASVNAVDGMWYQEIRAFLDQNPGVVFDFLNRGIPGLGTSSYLGNAYSQASTNGQLWYTSAANWYQFVALNPQTGYVPSPIALSHGCDIIIMAFGLNDSWNLSPVTLWSIKNIHWNTSPFSSRPGIIWITSPSANPNAGPPYSLPNYVAGYIANGSLVRSAAQVGASGFSSAFAAPVGTEGVIDYGRFFQMAVLGKDYQDQVSTNNLSALQAAIGGSTYTFQNGNATGSISGSIYTVTAVNSGTVKEGQIIASATARTQITGFVSGSGTYGGPGQYTIDTSQTQSSFTSNLQDTVVLPGVDGDFQVGGCFLGLMTSFVGQNGISLGVSSMNGNSQPLSTFQVTATSTTGILLNYNAGSTIALSRGFSVTSLPDFCVSMSVKQNLVSLTTNGKNWTNNFIKAEAPFNPYITLLSSVTAPVTLTFTSWAAGAAHSYNPIFSEGLAYGQGTVSTAIPSATTNAGSAVINFASLPTPPGGGATLAGLQISDVPVPTAIPAGTTVLSMSGAIGGAGSITMSNNAAYQICGTLPCTTDVIAFGNTLGSSGGNFINHPASPALNYALASALQASDLCLICYATSGANQAYSTVVVTTGATTVATPGLLGLTLNPSGTIAAHTTTLPTNPQNNQRFTLRSTQTVTAETVQVSSTPSGQSISSAYTAGGTLTPSTPITLTYNQSLNLWAPRRRRYAADGRRRSRKRTPQLAGTEKNAQHG
jgi:hypothetical protein